MSDEQLHALADNIHANKLNEPITLTPARQLLDGKNRARACEILGIEPAIVIYDGDPVAFTIMKNGHRLRPDKRALAFVGARLATAKQGGDRKSEDYKIKVSDDTLMDDDKTAEQIAAELGISRKSLFDAKAILDKGTPEIIALAQQKHGLRRIADYVRHTPPEQQDLTGFAIIRQPKNGTDSPEMARAREIVRPLIAAGTATDRFALQEQHGIGHNIFQRAVVVEKARLDAIMEAAPFDPSTLSLSAQKKLEVYQRHLDRQFEGRVHAEVAKRVNETILPFYKERMEKAELLAKAGKPFTNAQFRLILAALHPDSNADIRKDAFILVKSKEILLRPEEKDRPFTSDLPATVADLLARRRTKAR
jgi:hypothetical protein